MAAQHFSGTDASTHCGTGDAGAYRPVQRQGIVLSSIEPRGDAQEGAQGG